MNARMTSGTIIRMKALGVASILALAACGSADDAVTTAAAESGERSAVELPTDRAEGDAGAPVTVIEYASVSCGACGNWANTVYPEFKERFIDTGEVRYIFREFPAGNQQLFMTGSIIANCADRKNPGAFLPNIKLQFERQNEIFRYAQQAPEQLRDQYFFIAEQGGLSEEETLQCLTEDADAIREEMEERWQLGFDAGVTGTPGFIVNGVYKPGLFEIDEFEAAIAEAKGEAPDEG